MTVFDPDDRHHALSWLAASHTARRRRASDRSRGALQRWAVVVAFCLCFATLGPASLVPATFAGLLLVAALGFMALAIRRGEHPFGPHLTLWDEALLSLALGMAAALWFALTSTLGA